MDWSQVLFLFLANGTLIAWFRAESRADWRHMDSKTQAIYDSIKDFHGKLCELEARELFRNKDIKKR